MLIISLNFLKSERFSQTAPAQLKPFFLAQYMPFFVVEVIDVYGRHGFLELG